MPSPVVIADDGRCTCSCATPCPLKRTGMAPRCTREDLEAAGIPTVLDSRIPPAKKKPVLTKKDFVKRFQLGEFGNASPTWDSYAEWKKSRAWDYGSLFHIRNRIAGEETWYNIHFFHLRDYWLEACLKYKPSQLYISAMAPTEKTLFQGEVMRGVWGLELLYTTVAKPMRDALAERCTRVRGIIAVTLLKHFLCPNSYAWLEHLLETYPDHVVEFSTFSCNWGTISGFNTVFWEVRKY